MKKIVEQIRENRGCLVYDIYGPFAEQFAAALAYESGYDDLRYAGLPEHVYDVPTFLGERLRGENFLIVAEDLDAYVEPSNAGGGSARHTCPNATSINRLELSLQLRRLKRTRCVVLFTVVRGYRMQGYPIGVPSDTTDVQNPYSLPF